MAKQSLTRLPVSLRLSLCLLALIPVVPLLPTSHAAPISTFYTEWMAIVLGLLLAFSILPILYRFKCIHIPRITLLPLIIMVVIGVQIFVLPQVVNEHAQMAVLYLLWSMLLMVLVRSLIAATSLAYVSYYLAVGLVIASASAAIYEFIFRLLDFHQWWGGVGQANNYGDLLALGFASALYILTIKPKQRNYWLGLMAIIVLGLSLTTSRSVWLYWLVMMLLSWKWQRQQLSIIVAGIVLYGVFQLCWANDLLFSSVTAAERLAERMGGTSIRGQLWTVAWRIFIDSPWIGVGFGQFDWEYFNAGFHIPEATKRAEHAHNIVLHLLAEVGLIPVLALFSMLGYWFKQLLTTLLVESGLKKNPVCINAFPLWLLMLMAVLGIHSLLEYPLWYAQFLIIAAFVLALGEDKFYTLKIAPISVFVAGALLTFALIFASVHLRHYKNLEQAMNSFGQVSTKKNIGELIAVAKNTHLQAPLLTPYVSIIFTLLANTADKNFQADLSVLAENSSLFWPSDRLIYRNIEMLALTGRREESEILMGKALLAYSHWTEDFIKELNVLNEEDQKKVEFLRQMVNTHGLNSK